MSQQTIYNRESFLTNISNQLGRKSPKKVERPVWKFQPQWDVLKGASQDELLSVLKEQCSNIHTDLLEATSEHLNDILTEAVKSNNGKSIAAWDDPRFREYGIVPHLQEQNFNVHTWDSNLGGKNIEITEKADVGITFSDRTLAESGTVVLFSDNGKGRSVSLLPTTYIAIIPKSTIVARMSQVTREIHQKQQQGELVASCVNFISGPSNSADIEMNLVVGVHGPIKATYIVITDR